MPAEEAVRSEELSRRWATWSRLISAGRGNLGALPNPPSLASNRSSSWPAQLVIALAAWLASKMWPTAADQQWEVSALAIVCPDHGPQ